ncbi:cilia- and flagella-associated protein 100 [Seriola aureovittata]|uniref:cilia- and flagella-associated protein 100 n=1 Tax=Seriola aureovittata TaxID=2871759 RepID=UPI0024BDCC78|nr:cilia- and flagella-associated protein 100 [Seriola aureovittata]XP_056238834.1 cilia- and flagella-associated protein 100 [Seriola aureovittata]XP_056238835.1 cilia- and flagella-associated protein 100 [Seriola aureovittata]
MPKEMSEMSSPQPKGPEVSSGSIVVSETESAAKSHKQDMRRRRKEIRQSPFKVPESNSIFLQSVNEKESQREEMRKFLALPIDKKTTHAARMMTKMKKELVGKLDEEEEGEKEKMKNLKQIKSKTTFPKQTLSRHELKMAMMKRENVTKDSKHDLISMERQKAVLELSLLTKRGEISRMDKAIAKEERQLKQLERMIARDNLIFEEFLRENEKKSVEARTFFEREAKSKQEKNAEIKKLTAEIGTINSELAKFEEILIDYKRYKELLFKLSPPEWQEAQKAKASLKSKVLCDKNTQDKQKRKPKESGISHGLVSSPGRELPCIKETSLSSAHSDTVITNSNLDIDISEYEDQPELYFSDPQQLLDLVTELTEQNLSLIQNSTRVEVTMEGLRQSVETARKKIEKEEEQLNIQIDEINQRINKEKAGGNKLKQKVQVHVSLNTEDQDVMLEALGDKVSEVYRSCVDDRMTNLSTLEKLVSIENRMSILLQGLESIPEKVLEMIKRIKDSERRTREREEKLREQREKQKERMRRYMERSLADSKKITGRKLMPRCMPVAPKVKVSNVDNIPVVDELHDYLFTSDDIE